MSTKVINLNKSFFGGNDYESEDDSEIENDEAKNDDIEVKNDDEDDDEDEDDDDDKEEEDDDDEDDDDDDEAQEDKSNVGESEEDQDGGANLTADIVDELSMDPMFIVLCHFLVSKKGNSLVDILDDIKDHLSHLRKIFVNDV